MEVVLKGDVKEIVTLLLELEVQRRISFVGETKYCLLNKQKPQPPVDLVKEAPLTWRPESICTGRPEAGLEHPV